MRINERRGKRKYISLLLAFCIMISLVPLNSFSKALEESITQPDIENGNVLPAGADSTGDSSSEPGSLDMAETPTSPNNDADNNDCLSENGDGISDEEEQPLSENSLPVQAVTYENGVSGKLWIDMLEDTGSGLYAGNGMYDAGEQPLAGYTVSLYSENDISSAVQRVTTDSDGKYLFTNIEPGAYVVGVAAATIGGTEYLLPFGITSDNQFAMAYNIEADACLDAYTDPIKIAEDTVITGVDAGMRTPPDIQPLEAAPPVVPYAAEVTYTIYEEYKNETTGEDIPGTSAKPVSVEQGSPYVFNGTLGDMTDINGDIYIYAFYKLRWENDSRNDSGIPTIPADEIVDGMTVNIVYQKLSNAIDVTIPTSPMEFYVNESSCPDVIPGPLGSDGNAYYTFTNNSDYLVRVEFSGISGASESTDPIFVKDAGQSPNLPGNNYIHLDLELPGTLCAGDIQGFSNGLNNIDPDNPYPEEPVLLGTLDGEYKQQGETSSECGHITIGGMYNGALTRMPKTPSLTFTFTFSIAFPENGF